MPQIEVACEYCGREFMIFPSLLKHGMGRYCSRSCSARATQGIPLIPSYVSDFKKVACVCEVCGGEFQLTPSALRQTENAARWCSKRCRSKAAEQDWACAYCGCEFKCLKGRVHWWEGGEGSFCSSECMRLSKWPAWADDIFDPLGPDGAYILGFLVADGHISGEGNRISFFQKEPTILQKIAVRLRFEGEVCSAKGNTSFRLSLSSKKAHKALTEKHGIPAGNKTFTVRLPRVGDALLPHLIRGIFDGDGTVAKAGKGFGYFSASRGLMEDFVGIMVQHVGLPHKEPRNAARGMRKDGTSTVCYHVRWGLMEAREFARFIYGPKLDVYGSSLYLERKKVRFMPLFTYWREKEFLEEELVRKRRRVGEVAVWYGASYGSLLVAARWYELLLEEERICPQCGKEFVISIVSTNRNKYCSRECFVAFDEGVRLGRVRLGHEGIPAMLREAARDQSAWRGRQKGVLDSGWVFKKLGICIGRSVVERWLTLPRRLKFQVIMRYGLGLETLEAQLQWLRIFRSENKDRGALARYLSEAFVPITKHQVYEGCREVTEKLV